MQFQVDSQIEIVNHLAVNKSQKLLSAVKHIPQFRVASHLVISEQLASCRSYSHSVFPKFHLVHRSIVQFQRIVFAAFVTGGYSVRMG